MAAFPAASIGRQTCERFTEWFPSGRAHCNGRGKTAQYAPDVPIGAELVSLQVLALPALWFAKSPSALHFQRLHL